MLLPWIAYQTATMAGPYRKADIPSFQIDYRGLTAYARKKGVHVCDLSDSEKDTFITDANMSIIRESALKA